MYIKWIVCNVKKDKKQEFSIAQEKWNKTAIAKGFIAQVGGWDLKNENIACIISFWKSKSHLENFMKNIHNEILTKNKQAKTYKSITVKYFNSLLDIENNTQSITGTIQNGRLLRISNYNVKNGKEKHFEKVQNDLWFPEIKKSKGMLGGFLLKSSSKISNYLVSTFWNSPENHTIYLNNKLDNLKADEISDIEKTVGKEILLVNSWKIINKT